MNIKFYDLILRCPLRSLDAYFKDPDSDLATDRKLNHSIYFASRNFHRLLKGPVGTKARRALQRYHLRSIFRSTPFGLFAGCGTIVWGGKTKVRIDGTKRKTSLDFQVLADIYYTLLNEKWFYTKLIFYQNNTLYSIDGIDYRFVDYEFNDNREYRISEAKRSQILQKILVLTKEGSKFSELILYLKKQGYQLAESHTYLLELISNRILISTLEPNVMCGDYLQVLTDFISDHANGERGNSVRRILDQIKKTLSVSDKQLLQIASYEKIYTLLREIGIHYENKQILHTDAFLMTTKGTLEISIQDKLRKTLALLLKWNKQEDHKDLGLFKQSFVKLYGNQEVALALAMDHEAGIGYPANLQVGVSSFLEGIKLKSDGTQMSNESDDQSKLLLEGIANWERTKAPIDLTAFHDHSPKDAVNLPPTFSVMFKVVDFKRGSILFQDAGNPSAANLVARFADIDPSLEDHLSYIVEHEKKLNPEIAFAEINYFPQGKLANILKRPLLRDKEIPILSVSKNKQDELPIADLRLSVVNDQIRLRSRKLNQYVVPRLSSAHNYTTSELPIYKFLCDLQYQNIQTELGFRWPSIFDRLKHTPRVTLGSEVILYPEAWRISKDHFLKFFGEDCKTVSTETADRFRNSLGLPRFVVHSDYDQELVVDFNRTTTLCAFLDSIKKLQVVELREFLFDPLTPISDQDGKQFDHQFIATITNADTSYPVEVTDRNPNTPAAYVPGTKWMYLKIYCSRSISNQIIANNLITITNRHLKTGNIDEWFFVRFTDPEYHLRVRIKLRKESHFGVLLEDLRLSLQPMIDNHLIQKTSIDTYQPELDRYGFHGIGIVEKIFHCDSELIAGILKLDRECNYDLDLLIIKIVDVYLSSFHFTIEQKMKFCEKVRSSYYEEFHIKKVDKMAIDKSYRELSSKIASVVELRDEQLMNLNIGALLDDFSDKIQTFSDKLAAFDHIGAPSIEDLLISVIHMSVNRACPYSPRASEMIIYDFLFRNYRSTIAKARSHEELNN